MEAVIKSAASAASLKTKSRGPNSTEALGEAALAASFPGTCLLCSGCQNSAIFWFTPENFDIVAAHRHTLAAYSDDMK